MAGFRRFATQISDDTEAPIQSLVGLGALAEELAVEGISVDKLLTRTGVTPVHLKDASARISHRQRLAIYQNANRLATRPDIGLVAGTRQKISDYGMFGYAMVSSKTFGDALGFSLDHVTMAGAAVREISFRQEGGTAILQSHGHDVLGELLPFAAEYWRSSMTSLFSRVLEAPFPTIRMTFPFSPPEHWRDYERIFGCQVEFDSKVMEWHFDVDVLEKPCPNANPVMARICQQLCGVLMSETAGESKLVRNIRSACLNSSKRFPTASEMASNLGLSLRTLHRRLAEQNTSYQSILDGMRRSLATELLESTNLTIDQIAERTGFADSVGFRKAFKKWTGRTPNDVRLHPLNA
jgi:AraC-like DNA-binding protein